MKHAFLLVLILTLGACGKDKKSKAVNLSEDIQMNAAVYSNQIQLNSVFQSNSLTMNVCGLAPQPGKIYNYSLLGNMLTISDQRIQVVYQPSSTSGGVYGTWKMISSTDPELKSGSVEITYNSVRFISVCKGQ